MRYKKRSAHTAWLSAEGETFFPSIEMPDTDKEFPESHRASA